MKSTFLLILVFFFSLQIFPQATPVNPLEPNKFETPRETYTVFLKAMNDYKKGMESKDSRLLAELDTAARCLNLDGIPFALQTENGREASILLKEVIDRIAIIDPTLIPDVTELEEKPVNKWVFENSEIAIVKVESGERINEYLFSRHTVARALEFYNKTKHLPYKEDSGKGAGYKDPWTESLPGWMKDKLFSLFIWQLIGVILSIPAGFLLRWLTKKIAHFITRIFGNVPAGKINWKDKILDFCEKPLSFIVAIGFWFICLDILDIEGRFFTFFYTTLQVLLSFNLVRLVYDLTKASTEYIEVVAKERQHEFMIDAQIVPLLSRTVRAIVILLGSLLAMQNLGINVVSVLAGLGVGGLALALAAKDTAANLFGSIMIFLDRPFKVGDKVVIGGAEGEVEEIGFRCTRIRTLYDSIISIPNSEVANSKVDNLGLRRHRRSNFTIGLTLDTPPEKIEAFLEGTKNILRHNEQILQDRIHVIFQGFGSSSLEILVNYFVIVHEWGEDMILRQNVFLEIMNLAKELKVSFAFPTQTIHVETVPGQIPIERDHSQVTENLKQTAKDFGKNGKLSRPKGLGIFVHPSQENKQKDIGAEL